MALVCVNSNVPWENLRDIVCPRHDTLLVIDIGKPFLYTLQIFLTDYYLDREELTVS